MKRYFEGWYFKIVDASEANTLAVIPGVSYGDSSANAFIQVFNESEASYHYHTFGIEDFRSSFPEFEIAIGSNVFRRDGMELHICAPGNELEGVLAFDDPHPWPCSVWSPSAMGVLSLLPGLDCYHHVLSLQHGVQGCLSSGDGTIDFKGGRGYSEKSWGRSFPASWIWMQTNHFRNPALSFVLATSSTRLGGIRGLTCGLWTGEHLHQFCTWSGGRVAALDLQDREVRLSLRNRSHRLDVVGVQSTAMELPTPRLGDMSGSVMESLSSEISVHLYRRGEASPILVDEGRHAGMEIGGDPGELASKGGWDHD
jgi:hypothetical protein